MVAVVCIPVHTVHIVRVRFLESGCYAIPMLVTRKARIPNDKAAIITDTRKHICPGVFRVVCHVFHNIIVPNVYVRIYPNGKVLYSIRSVLSLYLYSKYVRSNVSKLNIICALS